MATVAYSGHHRASSASLAVGDEQATRLHFGIFWTLRGSNREQGTHPITQDSAIFRSAAALAACRALLPPQNCHFRKSPPVGAGGAGEPSPERLRDVRRRRRVKVGSAKASGRAGRAVSPLQRQPAAGAPRLPPGARQSASTLRGGRRAPLFRRCPPTRSLALIRASTRCRPAPSFASTLRLCPPSIHHGDCQGFQEPQCRWRRWRRRRR
ncbi:Protein of unknown function [Gryllus bimaculatus]|nr:Protein of unknown function [Gryllus bimaculatus]